MKLAPTDARAKTSDVQETVLYGPDSDMQAGMPPARDERVDTARGAGITSMKLTLAS